jgi:hypothetical protein
VAEGKLHDIDENLDELETTLAIFEAKLNSLPAEIF